MINDNGYSIYERRALDSDDQILLNAGWEFSGIGLFRHTNFRGYKSKAEALDLTASQMLECSTVNCACYYKSIIAEHQQIMKFLLSLPKEGDVSSKLRQFITTLSIKESADE